MCVNLQLNPLEIKFLLYRVTPSLFFLPSAIEAGLAMLGPTLNLFENKTTSKNKSGSAGDGLALLPKYLISTTTSSFHSIQRICTK